MNDDQIRELLDSAAPDQPDVVPGARTGAVRDRARAVRRRNGIALAAAAVVAVAAVGTGIAVVTSGDDPSGTRNQVAVEPTPSAVAPPECPAEPAVIDQDGKASTAEFPDGATSLRFCPATFESQEGTVEFTLPLEPLTEGVDALLDEVAAQQAYVFEDECASMMLAPMPWTMVVAYPDGSTVSVGATLTSCASITVDGTEVDVRSTLDLVSAAVIEVNQTSGIGPDTIGDCPEPAALEAILTTPDAYTGDLADFEPDVATVCYVPDPQGAREYAQDGGVVVGDDLAVLVDDLAANTTTRPTLAGRCTDSGPTRVITFSTGSDDVLARVDRSCTTEFAGGGLYWKAGEQAEAVIDATLGGRVGG